MCFPSLTTCVSCASSLAPDSLQRILTLLLLSANYLDRGQEVHGCDDGLKQSANSIDCYRKTPLARQLPHVLPNLQIGHKDLCGHQLKAVYAPSMSTQVAPAPPPGTQARPDMGILGQ